MLTLMRHGDKLITADLDRRTFLAAAGIGCSLDFPEPLQAAPVEPVPLGSSRQLFFDNRIIASSKGLTRVWHRPVKFAGNPVFRRERAWEGRGPYVYGTVTARSDWLTTKAEGRDQQLFKMWYNCYVAGRPDYWVCQATSRDGIHWDRPALNVVADPRLRAGNNVVMLGSGLPSYRQCLSPTVLYRPEERDPRRRYAMLYWDINGGRTIQFVCLAFSPDGIRWTNVKNNPVFDGASDVTTAATIPSAGATCSITRCGVWTARCWAARARASTWAT